MGYIDKEQLTKDNINLIYGFMKHYHLLYRREEILDILYIGFCIALNTFDPSKGSFTTHAYSCMLTQYMKFAKEEKTQKRAANTDTVSLNATFNDGEDELMDFVVDKSVDIEKEAERNLEMDAINDIREEFLTEKENAVIELYYINGYNDSDIARILDMSHSRVHELRNKALNKLRYRCRNMRSIPYGL